MKLVLLSSPAALLASLGTSALLLASAFPSAVSAQATAPDVFNITSTNLYPEDCQYDLTRKL